MVVRLLMLRGVNRFPVAARCLMEGRVWKAQLALLVKCERRPQLGVSQQPNHVTWELSVEDTVVESGV